MNSEFSLRFSSRRPQRGVALIIVLATLILLVGLIVAILSRVTAGRAVSSSYASGVNCRVLADTAVNVAIGQIHDATSDSTGTVGWASQPGAIRTYAGANFKTGYKLFSSSVMTTPDEATLVQGIDPNWKTKLGQYVNLNQPTLKQVQPAPAAVTKIYPIADPDLLTTDPKSANYVQGFAVADKTQAYQTNLEMPVEWIYQREDGTLTTGKYQADGTVKMNDSGAATAAKPLSPIKSRIAFWTDDESCKVNVNTASEGLYWDTPHVTTQLNILPGSGPYASDSGILDSPTYDVNNPSKGEAFYAYNSVSTDQGLGFYPPARDEYNRFPGHPAMTSLSAVFPLLTTTQIFDIAPRISIRGIPSFPNSGGSKMGTKSVVTTPSSIQAYGDSDRLYDSETEITLKTDSTAKSNPDPKAPAARILNDGILTADQVNKRRFVLTANSRAPELNLFGRPRVSMWPVSVTNTTFDGTNTANATRTPYDQLIAFCCTLNSSLTDDGSNATTSSTKWPFIFFRQNPYAILDSGDATTEATSDSLIASNQNLFDYLHDVTSQAPPGFGQSLSSKYNLGDSDQIITEMLDYVRCTNMFDTFLEGESYNGKSVSKGLEYTNGVYDTQGKPGHGQVLPLRIKRNGATTSGLGRTPTVTEVALHFICTADASEGGRTAVAPATIKAPSNVAENITLGPPDKRTLLKPGVAGSPGERRIQAMLHVELGMPMEGYPNISPCVEVEITGAEGITAGTVGGGTAVLFPKRADPKQISNFTYDDRLGNFNRQGATYWQSAASSGYLGFFNFVFLAKFPGTPNMIADTTPTVPSAAGGNAAAIPNYFIGDPFTVQPAGAGMKISASNDLLIKLYYPPDGSPRGIKTHQLYQTLHVKFPTTMTVPIPTLDTTTGGDPDIYTMSWTFAQNNYLGQYIPDGYKNANNDIVPVGGRFVQKRKNSIINFYGGFENFILSNDVIRSMELRDGDFRLTSTMPDVPSTFFVLTNGAAVTAAPLSTANALSHTLTSPYYQMAVDTNRHSYTFNMSKPPGRAVNVGDHPSGLTTANGYPDARKPDIPLNVDYDPSPTSRKPFLTGDFDTGIGAQADGPFANMPDAGQLYQDTAVDAFAPYFWRADYDVSGLSKAFSPNRQIPSSGMFGSLPAGNKHGAWRTLLFRPYTSTPGKQDGTLSPHPAGSTNPPDHLFMDLFWMPVVQPYAISEPFSTAGKINLNYQMLPFTYINRQTALYALLKAERMLVIPDNQAANYKSDGVTQTYPTTWRLQIDPKSTLDQFQSKFDNDHQIFRSASEICDMHIIPQDTSYTGGAISALQMPGYWKGRRLTGDNLKERPYTNIYPRLTTQSNAYRVHYWVQSLKQINTDHSIFVDPESVPTGTVRKDAVTAQLRGSTIVERYLDSNDTRFLKGGDGVTTVDPMKNSLNALYKMRVYGNTVFAP